GLAPQTSEAVKTMENRPVCRKKWVRRREVTPPRLSAMMTSFEGSPRVLDGLLLGLRRPLECDSKADSHPMVRMQHGKVCGRLVDGGRDVQLRPARVELL